VYYVYIASFVACLSITFGAHSIAQITNEEELRRFCARFKGQMYINKLGQHNCCLIGPFSNFELVDGECRDKISPAVPYRDRLRSIRVEHYGRCEQACDAAKDRAISICNREGFSFKFHSWGCNRDGYTKMYDCGVSYYCN
jgi:hypothetical protein